MIRKTMVMSGEVNRMVTLCGKNWAKIGVEFMFLGGKPECENCKIKKTCLKLREGAKYKIVGLRDGTVQECQLHEDGVVAVEVVELPIIALVESTLTDGAKFRYEERKCEHYECGMYNLCHPLELRDGEIVIVWKVIGDSPEKCSLGYNFAIAELMREQKNSF
ncbi:MAG: UPF0179 family protein [Archaeoglobaceae archaeon]|nr:UPF0179 family protein [Archaeoglobaceae archaeon]MDW7989933.1 UPF0179 family protein [Archaeoglobaceae archaeon]